MSIDTRLAPARPFRVIGTGAARNQDVDLVECIACGRQGVTTFLEPDKRPLATIWWPMSESEAKAMRRYPHHFVRCIHCGHVFNKSFTYADVPYTRKSNLMFNQGTYWKGHLQAIRQLLLRSLPATPVVVEIGCGDGSLLREMAKSMPAGKFYGFDPNAASVTEDGVEFRGELFEPNTHLRQLRPDIIICRHVLEHLQQPMRFLEQIAVVASVGTAPVRMYLEVPCVDRAISICRLSDYYYEHNSHFTTSSLRAMLYRIGGVIESLDRYYCDEVLGAVINYPPERKMKEAAAETLGHLQSSQQALTNIGAQLDVLARRDVRVAVWGGTGKASSFMNLCGVDSNRFPCVVDSDSDKWNTYVPGTGQCIQSPNVLLHHPADIILIPMSWRARDIAQEMRRRGITCSQILIEHQMQLVDFESGDHPY